MPEAMRGKSNIDMRYGTATLRRQNEADMIKWNNAVKMTNIEGNHCEVNNEQM